MHPNFANIVLVNSTEYYVILRILPNTTQYRPGNLQMGPRAEMPARASRIGPAQAASERPQAERACERIRICRCAHPGRFCRAGPVRTCECAGRRLTCGRACSRACSGPARAARPRRAGAHVRVRPTRRRKGNQAMFPVNLGPRPGPAQPGPQARRGGAGRPWGGGPTQAERPRRAGRSRVDLAEHRCRARAGVGGRRCAHVSTRRAREGPGPRRRRASPDRRHLAVDRWARSTAINWARLTGAA